MTRRSDDDFAREIEAHLALEADQLAADGVDPDTAKEQARRAFGNVTRARERYYERRHAAWLDDLRRDLRSALRNVHRAPVVAIIVVLSLAGGIGAATVALVVRNVIFYNLPPLYAAAHELLQVQAAPFDRPILPSGYEVPAPLFRQWRQSMGGAIAGSSDTHPVDVRTPDGLTILPLRAVTPDLFSLLGVQPQLGRLFTPSAPEDETTTVVLSHDVWQRQFRGRHDIVGTAIEIDGYPFTVIGVLPERFWFVNMDAPIWVRFRDRDLPALATVRTVVRDATGDGSVERALRSGLQAFNHDRPAGEVPLHIRISPVRGTPLGDMMSLALPFIMGTAVLLTLLIACANAAVLLIAQWTARETDTAVRSSLGAGRSRVVRALLTEAVLLATAAGVCGVLATLAVRWWLVHVSGVDVRMFDLSIAPRVLLQAGGLAIIAGVAAGLAPALYETRRLQINPLRGLQASDRIRQRWSHSLVVMEIAITVALLVVASSMIAYYQRLQTLDFGFDSKRLVTLGMTVPDGVPLASVLDRIAAEPGIRAAAVGSTAPLYWRRPAQRVSVGPGSEFVRAQRVAMSRDYFTALGVPLRQGRLFGVNEPAESHTVIVNEAMARSLFNSAAVVGRQVWIEGAAYDIVGIAADYVTAFNETRSVGPKFFVPLSAADARSPVVVARALGNPNAAADALQRAIHRVAPAVIISRSETYAGMLAALGQEWLLSIAPLGPLTTIGMLLSAAGIYGVLAFAIARRTRELAVRVALGADARDQLTLVTMRSLRLVAAGAGVGVGLTYALARLVRAFGGEGSMMDPPWAAFVVPVLMILTIAGIATILPALRVRRIDPVVLLRTT